MGAYYIISLRGFEPPSFLVADQFLPKYPYYQLDDKEIIKFTFLTEAIGIEPMFPELAHGCPSR